MGLKKGQTNNKDGRPKGVPNKTTQSLRAWVNDFLNENLDTIKKDFKKLEPKDRVQLFEKLLKYSLPQLQAVSMKTDLQKFLSEAHINGQLSEDDLKRLSNLIVEQLKNNDEP